MANINNEIKYYTDLLNDGEFLLLKSKDDFFKNHYIGSPLNILTNFSGTCAEAIIDKQGDITIFVDTRYYLLVDKQVYPEVKVCKMSLGETFIDAFRRLYKKHTVLYVDNSINLKEYYTLQRHFDIKIYTIDSKQDKNFDLNLKEKIFLVDSKIEKQDFLYKIAKLRKMNSNMDKMLVFNLDEISYLTNLRSFQMKYSSNFKSILFLDFSTNKHILFVNKLLLDSKIKINGLTFLELSEFSNFIQSVENEIYFDFNEINLNQFVLIKNPKENRRKNLRIISSIKSKAEIEHLLDSGKKLDLAIYNFKKKLKEGLSEVELVKIFENELRRQGSIQPSFKTLLAIDENTASIHYSTYDKNKVLKNESLLLLDCGGYFEAGLATDITRTFYFGNNPKAVYKKVYTNVLKAFISSFKLKETNAVKLDKHARELLKPLELDGFYFNHALGHGIGTSVHQNPPLLAQKSKDIIKPFQVHSIEPGLYGKTSDGVEFGVRIENCVFSDINFDKKTITKFSFEEILIDYNLLTEEEIGFVKNWNKEAEQIWK